MEIGDLVKTRSEPGRPDVVLAPETLWLVLDTIDNDALVFNASTSYKMWAPEMWFEALNESR